MKRASKISMDNSSNHHVIKIYKTINEVPLSGYGAEQWVWNALIINK